MLYSGDGGDDEEDVDLVENEADRDFINDAASLTGDEGIVSPSSGSCEGYMLRDSCRTENRLRERAYGHMDLIHLFLKV